MKNLWAWGVAMAAVFISSAAARADVGSVERLERRIEQLEALLQQQLQEVDAGVAMLRDAAGRSFLLSGGEALSAGFDGGFFIRSGAFILRPTAQLQVRQVINYRSAAADGGRWNRGFEMRRAKFALQGSAFSPELQYAVGWGWGRDGGEPVLEDAMLKWRFAEPWAVRVGQYKVPIHREELMGASRGLAADRSMVNALVGGGAFGQRSQGPSLIYGDYRADSPVNVELMVHDGTRSANTAFTDHTGAPFGAAPINWGVGGRVEWRVSGNWGNYRDFTALGTREDLLVLGAGFDWSQAGSQDQRYFTIDAQYENSQGLALFAALLGRRRDLAGGSSTDLGSLAQAGYLLTPAWELFGRWGWVGLDDAVVVAGATRRDFHELTIGVNHFMGRDGSAGHRARLTVDLTWLPRSAPTRVTGVGALGSADSELILRTQVQLLL